MPDNNDKPLQHTDKFELDGFDPFKELRATRIADTLRGNDAANLGGEGAAHNHKISEALKQTSAGDPRMRFMPELTVQPRKRAGRTPAFYRVEVERIRADQRPVAQIAAYYGVSEVTIRRIQQRGVYKGLEYIAADDLDRRVLEDGTYVQQPMYSGSPSTYVPTGRPAGRPLKNRAAPLSDVARKEIVASTQTVRELAERYEVSVATISRIRREALAPIPEGMTVYEAMARDIRPAHIIARFYRTTAAQVHAARQRYPQAYEQAMAAADAAHSRTVADWQARKALEDAKAARVDEPVPHEVTPPKAGTIVTTEGPMFFSGNYLTDGSMLLFPFTPDGLIDHPDYGEVTEEQFHIIEKELAEQNDAFADWLAQEEAGEQEAGEGEFIDPRGHDFDDEPDTMMGEPVPSMEELFSPEAIRAYKEHGGE